MCVLSISLEVQSSENLPRVDIAGSCLVYFPLISLRNLCTDLHSGCTNLHFYQQSLKDFSFSTFSTSICCDLFASDWDYMEPESGSNLYYTGAYGRGGKASRKWCGRATEHII